MGFQILGRDPFNQNFRKFRSKTQWIGSVQPEKFRKNWSTFWGGPLFPVGPVGILVQWIAPGVSQSIKIGIDLSIDISIKIGKSDLIDIECIHQSVEIDDTLVSFIDLSWYIPIPSIYIGTYICSSKNENWLHASSKFVDNWVAIESRRIKQLSLFNKIFLKKPEKSYLVFKTRFKILFWWLVLGSFSQFKSAALSI